MEKDNYKTKVVFRKFKEGDMIALFPYEKYDYCNYDLVQSYMHIGQHTCASYSHCIRVSKLATPEEYKELFEELESIGYNLQVIKKAKF